MKKNTESRRKSARKERLKQERKARRLTRCLILAVVVLLVAIISLVASQMHQRGGKGDTTLIMLDAGHGGDASGIQGIASEDAVDEEIVNRLEEKLSGDSRFTVMRTHDVGTAMNNEQRVQVINDAHPDLVLSIHCADSMNPDDTGARVFADIPSSRYHEDSLRAAEAISTALGNAGMNVISGYYYYHPIREGVFQEHIVDFSDETDYQEDTLDLLKLAEAPVVRVEQFHVNNQADVDAWADEQGFDQAAQIYYDVLVDLYGAN